MPLLLQTQTSTDEGMFSLLGKFFSNKMHLPRICLRFFQVRGICFQQNFLKFQFSQACLGFWIIQAFCSGAKHKICEGVHPQLHLFQGNKKTMPVISKLNQSLFL